MPPTSRTPMTRTRLQTAALLVGAAFLLVGIAGFIPGVTTHYDQLRLAGPHSGALLLNLFEVSVLHNLVHLAFGIAGILAARTAHASRLYLIVGGLTYAVVWIYGVVVDDSGDASNFLPFNSPDNALHFALAVAMVALGYALSRHDGSAHATR